MDQSKLQKRIDEINGLRSKSYNDPALSAWKRKTRETLISIFGAESRNLVDFQTISFSPVAFNMYDEDDRDFVEAYQEGLDRSGAILGSILSDIEDDTVLNNTDSQFLHPEITRVSFTRFTDGHYPDAVEAAFKEVIKRVKDYVKNHHGLDLDGDSLMNRAFGCTSQEPLIKFNTLSNKAEHDEQTGIMNLFKGIVGIRNRKAHENVVLDDREKAFNYLHLASLLMRLLDDSLVES